MLTINTNTSSLFAQNSLSGAQNALATSVQRLSSGLRINNAADDAVGLAISQNLQSQINGVNQSIQCLSDATSLLQVADSSLASIQDMLLKMKQLATQGLDASLNANQRLDIANQLDDLNSEINATAERTQYNGIKLLSSGASAVTNNVLSAGSVSNASASISGFSSANDLVALDPAKGFEITVNTSTGSTTYSTKSGVSGTSFSALQSSLTDTNGNQFPKLSDLVTWINGLTGANLQASIDSSNNLQINPANPVNSITSIVASGLNPLAIASGFVASNAAITLDPSTGFVVSNGTSTYSSIGQLPQNTTLTALASWVDGLGSNLQASIIQNGASYSLAIYQNQSSANQAISATGILSGAGDSAISSNNSLVTATASSASLAGVVPVSVSQLAAATSFSESGFQNLNDKVNSNFSITVGASTFHANQINTINGHALAAISQSGLDGSGNSYSTVSDLNNWLQSLKGAGVSIDSSITGAPLQYNNDYSDIHVQGTQLAGDGTNLGDPYYELFSGNAPGNNDPHAIGPNLFQFSGLAINPSSAYVNDQFAISTDGQGNLILSAYNSGVLDSSEMVSIPKTFSANSNLAISFASLGATLNLQANVSSNSLGANKNNDLLLAANALVGNVGGWGSLLDQYSGSPNSIPIMQSAGQFQTFTTQQIIPNTPAGNYTDTNSNGNPFTDMNGNPDAINYYQLSQGQDQNYNPTLILQGYDSNGLLLASDEVPVDSGYINSGVSSLTSENTITYNFNNNNLSLTLNLSSLPPNSPLTEAAQIASQLVATDYSPTTSDSYSFQNPFDVLNSGLVTVNSFNPAPYITINGNNYSAGYALTSDGQGGLILSAYNLNDGSFVASTKVSIDPSQIQLGQINLDFGYFGNPFTDVTLNASVDTSLTATQIANQLASNFSSGMPSLPGVGQSIGPIVGNPTHVGNVTELDYANVGSNVTHFLINSSGTSVTVTARDQGNNILGSQMLTVPTVTAGNPFALDFNNVGGQGALKFVIDPTISTSSNASASSLIAQSLMYANRAPGVPGWLTFDQGSGLSLNIQGTQTGLANAVTVNNLSAVNEVSGGNLTLTSTVNSTAQDTQFSIGGNSYSQSNNNSVTKVISGTSYTVNPASIAQANVTITNSGDPLQSDTPSISNVKASNSNANLQPDVLVSNNELEFQSGATSNFHVTVKTINVLTNTNGNSAQMTALGNNLTQSGAGNMLGLTASNSVSSWQSSFKNLSSLVDGAIDYISTQRANYGTQINAIYYNVQSLQTQSLNTQTTKSAITDTNFALETAHLAKGQIMQQASTAVAAQANQAPSAVLGLLSKSFSDNYNMQNFVY